MTFVTLDRLPPHDIEAEEAVIAAAMVAAQNGELDAIPRMAAIVKPEHFFREKNGWIWEAVLALHADGTGVNQITVARVLAAHDRLEAAGGQTYLAEVIRRLPTVVGCEFYAQIVEHDATYRRIIHAATGIMQLAYEAPADLANTRASIQGLIDEATGGGYEESLWDSAQVADAVLVRLNRMGTGERPVEATPLRWWRELDRILQGLQAPRLITVGADTSVGKSLFLQNVAAQAIAVGKRLLIVTTEMLRDEWAERIAYLVAGVNPWAAQHQPRLREDVAKVVTDDLAPSSVRWAEGGMSAKAYESMVRRARAVYGIDGVILDHFGDIDGEGREERVRIMDAAKRIHNAGMKNGVWTVMASHVSRVSAQEKVVRHLRLSDLYGSSGIEKYSHQVLLLNPVDAAGVPIAADVFRRIQGERWLTVALEKNRHGPSEDFRMYLDWRSGGRIEDCGVFRRVEGAA